MKTSSLKAEAFNLDSQVEELRDRRLKLAANLPKPHNIPAIGIISALVGLGLAFALLSIAPFFK